MDLYKLIGELVAERDRIARIIESLEEASGAIHTAAAKKRRGRKSMDAQARRDVSERMRIYWAKRREESKS